MIKKVKVVTEKGYTHIFFDGEEITGVVAADMYWRVDSLPVVRIELNVRDVDVEIDSAQTVEDVHADPNVLARSIKTLRLSVQVQNALARGSIVGEGIFPCKTIGDVYNLYKTGRLKKVRGIGVSACNQVENRLKELKLL